MPTKLRNGVTIYNATPHDLHFEMENGETITAPTDVVMHCQPKVTLEKAYEAYVLNSVEFLPTQDGYNLIKFVKDEYPDIVILGSLIAAQAYPGLVATAVPSQGGKRLRSYKVKTVRPDRFTIYPPQKEKHNG